MNVICEWILTENNANTIVYWIKYTVFIDCVNLVKLPINTPQWHGMERRKKNPIKFHGIYTKR